MKYIKLVVLISVIFLTTGCWNYHELNSLAIVGTMGIDIEGDNFIVSVAVTNSNTVASSSGTGGGGIDETPTTVYKSKAKTLNEAIKNMVFESPQPIYIGHMGLLVISEEAAKKGILNFLDFLMADAESRKIFPTVIVKNGKAIDVLNIITPLITIASDNIKSRIESISKINSTISNRSFDEILMCLYQEGRHPTITTIEIIGNPKDGKNVDNVSTTTPKTVIRIYGTAVLKGDKLVGYLNKSESLGYTIIRDKAQTMHISFPCDDNGNYGGVVIDDVKNKLEVNIKNNKPVAEINVTGKAALPEYNCKFDITKVENIEKVENMVNKEVKNIINKSIIKVKNEYESDIFGFGERLFKDHNSYWEKNKDKWNDIFPKMDYKINVDISIESIVSTGKTAKDE